MSRTQTKRIIFACVAAGFLGAVSFYSPYLGLGKLIGLGTYQQYACPVCPHVTIVGGTPLSRFLRLALPMAFLNAVLFSVLGWAALWVGTRLKRLIASESQHR